MLRLQIKPTQAASFWLALFAGHFLALSTLAAPKTCPQEYLRSNDSSNHWLDPTESVLSTEETDSGSSGIERGENEESEREEPERIETDRHDFTQSTKVVPWRTRQIEYGYTFFQNSTSGEEDENSHTGPELLVRIGLRPNLEFRIRYNEVWQFGEEDRRGSEDLRFGLKTELTQLRHDRPLLPESALELRLSAPTGNDAWSTGDVEFGFDYIYGWKLTDRSEFYGSTGFSTNALGEFGFAVDNPSENNFELFTQSFALGTELTERVTIYSEFFGLFTDGFEDEEENPVFFNVGVDFFLSDDVVVDVRVGTGLNDDAEDFFFGVGGGFRF